MSGVPVSRAVPAATAWALRPAYSLAGALRAPSLRRFACGLTDQVLSVGGMFAVNIALARVRSKEEYGLFTLSYSLFTFLAGLHNAAILEAYTIYGSGRYHGRFAKYEAFVSKNNRWLLAGISVVFVAIWESLRWLHPAFASPALLGMALACGVLSEAGSRGTILRSLFRELHGPAWRCHLGQYAERPFSISDLGGGMVAGLSGYAESCT